MLRRLEGGRRWFAIALLTPLPLLVDTLAPGGPIPPGALWPVNLFLAGLVTARAGILPGATVAASSILFSLVALALPGPAPGAVDTLIHGALAAGVVLVVRRADRAVREAVGRLARERGQRDWLLHAAEKLGRCDSLAQVTDVIGSAARLLSRCDEALVELLDSPGGPQRRKTGAVEPADCVRYELSDRGVPLGWVRMRCERGPVPPVRETDELLRTLFRQASLAIARFHQQDHLRRALEEVNETYTSTVAALGAALDTRDNETAEHSVRVVRYALRIGRALGLSAEEMTDLERGAALHDIGKIGVPDDILRKPGSLDDREWHTMKGHALIGYELLSGIPFLERAAQIPLCHHENWDGSGYPLGLEGREIPLIARIFSVADALDTITSDRPYRRARPLLEALEEIAACAGQQFDPDVAKAIMEVPIEEVEAIGSVGPGRPASAPGRGAPGAPAA